MRMNYVMIDFENVQPESLAILQQDHFKVMLFVGANQTNIPFPVADAMQTLCGRAEYVKITGNGKNALDFHIAYYIGQFAAKDPTAYFHIISKDTGFDPLIAHLKTKKIYAARESDIGEIPLIKTPPVTPPLPIVSPPPSAPSLPSVSPLSSTSSPSPAKIRDQRIDTILKKLRPPKATKPRTVKTMSSHIKAMFLNAIKDPEIDQIITAMEKRKFITVKDGKINYTLL